MGEEFEVTGGGEVPTSYGLCHLLLASAVWLEMEYTLMG